MREKREEGEEGRRRDRERGEESEQWWLGWGTAPLMKDFRGILGGPNQLGTNAFRVIISWLASRLCWSLPPFGFEISRSHSRWKYLACCTAVSWQPVRCLTGATAAFRRRVLFILKSLVLNPSPTRQGGRLGSCPKAVDVLWRRLPSLSGTHSIMWFLPTRAPGQQV